MSLERFPSFHLGTVTRYLEQINSLGTFCHRIMLHVKLSNEKTVSLTPSYSMTITEPLPLVHCVRTHQLGILENIHRLAGKEDYAPSVPSQGKNRPEGSHTSYIAYIQHVLQLGRKKKQRESQHKAKLDLCMSQLPLAFFFCY